MADLRESVALVIEQVTCADPDLAEITAKEVLRAIADEIDTRRTRYDTAKYPIDDLVRDLRTEADR